MHRHLTIVAAALSHVVLAGGAVAETKTLYVGMNGGNFEHTYTQVFADFEKQNDVKVFVVPGTSSDILAKALAAKDKPQMHLMFLDDGVMVRAVGPGDQNAPASQLTRIERRRETRVEVGCDGNLSSSSC